MQAVNKLEENASRSTARRTLVFALPPMENALDRSLAQEDASKLVQRAAVLAARAGREGAAIALLDVLEMLESGKA